MVCSDCGTAISRSARFCPNCGAEQIVLHAPGKAEPPGDQPPGKPADVGPPVAPPPPMKPSATRARPRPGKLVAAAVVVAVVVGGSLAVKTIVGGGSAYEAISLGVQPPPLGDRPDLFQLAGRVFTSDGCNFGDSREEDTGVDVVFNFECPDETEFISGSVRIGFSASETVAADLSPNECHESGGFSCSLHDGLVTIDADGATLAQARERLMAVAGAVAALPDMTGDPGPSVQSELSRRMQDDQP